MANKYLWLGWVGNSSPCILAPLAGDSRPGCKPSALAAWGSRAVVADEDAVLDVCKINVHEAAHEEQELRETSDPQAGAELHDVLVEAAQLQELRRGERGDLLHHADELH